ncbi:MAG TPA: hypothetical protein VF787_25045 [Thermoanaerobaculia bacterium]
MHTARIQLVAAQGTAGDKLRMRTFVEFQLIGEDGGPVPAEEYAVTLPGGKVVTGTLDAAGTAHISGISAGTCEIAFPQLDQDAWVPVQT